MENPDGTCTIYMYTARSVAPSCTDTSGLHFGSDDCQNVKTGSEIEAKLAKQAMSDTVVSCVHVCLRRYRVHGGVACIARILD